MTFILIFSETFLNLRNSIKDIFLKYLEFSFNLLIVEEEDSKFLLKLIKPSS